MNKKGQTIGMFLVAFVGIIVALALYQGIAPYIGIATGVTLVSPVNASYTVPANGASIDITGQELVGTPVVLWVNGSTIPSSNYTIAEGIKSTGVKGILYKNLGAFTVGNTTYISYSYYPDGYIDDAGGRGIALLIPIMAVIAIMLIALVPALKNEFFALIGKN